MSRLNEKDAILEQILTSGITPNNRYADADIRRETVWVSMRDGIRLATDVYLPPVPCAPVIAMRTPYGRARIPDVMLAFARAGYVVLAQDCRGTGDSEPDSWDYYVYEPEDGIDFVEWATRQSWYDGFIGACGASYAAQVQWCMSMHSRISAIAPQVSGLGFAFRTNRKHMFHNAYARSVGKGVGKVSTSYDVLERQMLGETLASGYFNDPLYQPFPSALVHRFPELNKWPPAEARRWLWDIYCGLSCSQRANLIKLAFGVQNVTILEIERLPTLFGQHIAHDSHTLPHADRRELCCRLNAPALMLTGWYDWGLDDTLATWDLLTRSGKSHVRGCSRLVICPSAHNAPGYREGYGEHPELERSYATQDVVELLLQWYEAVRTGAVQNWPKVIYHLMGANEWQATTAWPPPGALTRAFYLGLGGSLTEWPPQECGAPDQYTYDPEDPTPTVGGSIVSSVYPRGSVDVAAVQARADVLTYTSQPLKRDLDIVGPLSMVLYASSSAVDTDFSARLSDVFPDGRAIQLQNGILRARYHNLDDNPELLEPGRIYRLEIDMWATANRFKAGHRLRLDISSADFPRFDRNTNRGGEPGPPMPALQTVYHDPDHPSHLLVSVLDSPMTFRRT